MRRALVTGGCGFVGRHFVRRLLGDGWQVLIVDDLSSGIPPYEWNMGKTVQFSPGQLDFAREDLRDWISSGGKAGLFDLMIHCAAVVGGRLKIDGDPLAVATDLAIDSDFFNWIVNAENRPKVVYFSSSAVYPVSLQRRESYVAMAEALVNFENTIGVPDMTYGWARLTGELLARHAVRTYNADVVIYRPFSGYGEDQSLDYPFPSIIRRVVNRENPITIWGSGDQSRDFIHIDDIVEAVMQTRDVLAPGEVLNLGTGVATSFYKLARLAAFGVIGGEPAEHPEIVCDTTRPEGVFYRVADTYRLDRLYRPKISLEEGIRRVVAHLTEAKEAV